MTAIATPPHHRIGVATARMHAELDAVADAAVWSMDPAETASTLVALERAEARVVELKARVAAHADDLGVGLEEGASSAAAWLAAQTRATRPAAHHAVRLGHALAAHPTIRAALAAGEITAEQARVALRSLEALPETVPEDLVAQAETHLVGLAGVHDARELDRLGKRLFEVIAPDEADAREARRLAAEEAAAARACHLSGHDDGQGKVHIRGILPTYHWAALRKMLQAIAAPKHQSATKGAGKGAGTARPLGPEAMGQALCELIERCPVERLPKAGGVTATMVVTLDQAVLTAGLEKAGVLDTGERISPAMARRLACEAGIIPAVMDGPSQVLDLGRRRRLFSVAQRIAIIVRQQGQCAAEGCDRSSGLHAHHLLAWSQDGPTDLANAIGLCHWHHNRAHDTGYEMRQLSGWKVAFHRRT